MSNASSQATVFGSFEIYEGESGRVEAPPALDKNNAGYEVILDARPVAQRALAVQKRVYRSRRKDPSCDACRDRKVRCNASEAASCSECSSRGARCQFTKESNRRMSSLKQIQDLQIQLVEARRQLSDLQAASSSVDSSGQRPAKSQIGTSVFMRPAPDAKTLVHDLSLYGQGLFRTPVPRRLQPVSAELISCLPPEDHARSLACCYFVTINTWLPIINSQRFDEQLAEVYSGHSEIKIQSIHLGIIYAVLGCGSRDRASHNNLQDVAVQIYRGNSKGNRGSVILALLISVSYMEHNATADAIEWTAIAVRTAQQLGLHTHRDDPICSFTRYLDGLISLDQGLPMLTNSVDCSKDILSTKNIDNVHSPIRLLANIFEKTLRALQLNRVEKNALSMLKHEIDAAQQQQNMIDSSSSAHFSMLLQSTKLHLYRHNLSPASTSAQRREALQTCVSIAAETAKILNSSLRHLSSSTEHYGSSFLYRHLWRCLLFLSASRLVSAAVQITSVLAQWQHHPELTTACSSYMTFFLEKLKHKSKDTALEDDEEMLLYLTADLQQHTTVAWAWNMHEDLDRMIVVDEHYTHSNWHAVEVLLHQLQKGDTGNIQASDQIIGDITSPATQATRVFIAGSASTSQTKISSSGTDVTTNPAPVHRISINDLV